MTDYKNLKLIASSSPHIRAKEDTRSIMLDVIIALLPALVFSIYNFGFRALIEVLVSVAACVFWEWGYRKVMKKPQMVGDFSAIVTGILLAFVCPVTLPWWTLVIGAFFSIVVVKQLYGGIGCNFLNPALAGRAILLASYATAMTTWVKAGEKLSAFWRERRRGHRRHPAGHHEGGHVRRPDQHLHRNRPLPRQDRRLPR